MTHKFGVLKEDDFGLSYLIPQELVPEFDSSVIAIDDAEIYSELWNSAMEYFTQTFKKYRLEPNQKIMLEE